MRFFDLHCDTLCRCHEENKGLVDNEFHISIKKGKNLENWIECFAIWIDDKLTNQEASDFFDKLIRKFESEKKINSNSMFQIKNESDYLRFDGKKLGALIALEGSKAINGDLGNLERMKNLGISYITLTWNGECDVGSGCGVENPRGLTKFGKEVISKMNELSIIPDVSHASDALFYDVARRSQKSIIATHSNSREVCNHKRNLTDDQFRVIVSMGGIVGINFCMDFLKKDGNPDFSDIRKHVEHFLNLSGEKSLCIGSDFDGTDVVNGIEDVGSINLLYDYFLNLGYSKYLLDDIFFYNAYRFFKNY